MAINNARISDKVSVAVLWAIRGLRELHVPFDVLLMRSRSSRIRGRSLALLLLTRPDPIRQLSLLYSYRTQPIPVTKIEWPKLPLQVSLLSPTELSKPSSEEQTVHSQLLYSRHSVTNGQAKILMESSMLVSLKTL